MSVRVEEEVSPSSPYPRATVGEQRLLRSCHGKRKESQVGWGINPRRSPKDRAEKGKAPPQCRHVGPNGAPVAPLPQGSSWA